MPVLQVPDRWVARYARLTAWLFGLVAAAWLVLVALWMTLHLVIVPRIDQFRPWLQERASAALGLRVEMGHISAQSHGWVPEFKIHDIRLLDGAGQAQLELAQVTLALTPTSALQGEFSQIALDQLDLEVVRDPQGVIRIGGLALSGGQDDRLRNWVFSQWEWVLRHSRISWTDQARGLPTAHFTDLEGVLRNGLRHHRFRLDGSPEAPWGERVNLRGDFKQPLLSGRSGAWEEWSGQTYLETRQMDWHEWSQLWPQTERVNLVSGQGWLRAWIDWRAGELQQVSADVALRELQANVRLAPRVQGPINLKEAHGRISWSPGRQEKWSLQSMRLEFAHTAPWLIGQASLALQHDAAGALASGQAQIDRVELGGLSALQAWMPETMQATWAQLEPRGTLSQVEWRWQGDWDHLRTDSWRASVRDLSLNAATTSKERPMAAWPGVSGLSAELSGHANDALGKILVNAGTLNWPGLWETRAQTIHQFKADVQWQRSPEGQRLRLKQAQLLTQGARADFDMAWSNTPTQPLGHIDLQATVPQASVAQIIQWLPNTLPDSVRKYVRLALPQGEARQIQARVKGPLQDFPFSRPETGEFRIQGLLSNVRYVTLPRALMDNKTSGDWPIFQNLSGELLFDRDSVRLSKVKARLAQAPGIAWPALEAHIDHLDHAVVEVKAEGKGPLAEALGFWRLSPLNAMTDRVLDGARGQGLAEYRLQLAIPVNQPEDTQAKGSVQLNNNEVVMATGGPALSRLRGAVLFTADGFQLQGVQASLWGGDVKLEGGSQPQPGGQPPLVQIKAAGQLYANGLRDAPELRDWSVHLKKLQGSTAYSAMLQWRRGQLESRVSSDLVGMAIQAPAGLGKTANESLPLRWDSSLTPESTTTSGLLQEQSSLRIGTQLEARYVRDLSGAQPKVLRGLIRWGGNTASILPPQGVTLRVSADTFKLDEWSDWMQPFNTTPLSGSDAGAWNFAPQRLEFGAHQVLAQGRQINQVQMTAQRVNESWVGQIRAQEMEGEVQYTPSKPNEPARLRARLNRLTVPNNANTDAEVLLDDSLQDLPALDIVVKDLDLKGKKLGALELQAQNRTRADGTREWLLSKLQVSNDDGEFLANGQWRRLPASTSSQTQFDFTLNLKNAGGMLQRLGLGDAIRSGHGTIDGQLNWIGSPISPETKSMAGQFKLGLERGQFLKTEPGAARLLGVLSLQALPRRLMLDFRDVFSEGFAFDFFRGDVHIDHGLATSNNLQMKGVNVAVLMEGQANIVQETQDLKVLVIPDINAGGASLVYSAINPVVGLTTFLAQYVLRRPLMESATQQFHVDGTWSEPKVTQVPFKPEPKP